MREAVFDSAVLADADRKSCGEDVFAALPSRSWWQPPGRACPFPDVERLGTGLGPARGAQLRARIILVDHDQLRPYLALVFEHASELGPSGVQYASVQSAFRGLAVGQVLAGMFGIGFRLASSGHVPDGKVLDDHRLVVADDVRGQLVQEVTALVCDARVDAGHLQLCLAMVVASFPFSAERPLRPCEAFEAFLQMPRILYHGALVGDGERIHSEVERDGVAFPAKGRDAFLDEDAHMPALRGVEAHGHRGGFRAFGQGPRPDDGQRFLHFGRDAARGRSN